MPKQKLVRKIEKEYRVKGRSKKDAEHIAKATVYGGEKRRKKKRGKK